ncbi:MAG: hypothetical protein ACR2NS_14050 [Gemmatimonadaceae bacterium]
MASVSFHVAPESMAGAKRSRIKLLYQQFLQNWDFVIEDFGGADVLFSGSSATKLNVLGVPVDVDCYHVDSPPAKGIASFFSSDIRRLSPTPGNDVSFGVGDFDKEFYADLFSLLKAGGAEIASWNIEIWAADERRGGFVALTRRGLLWSLTDGDGEAAEISASDIAEGDAQAGPSILVEERTEDVPEDVGIDDPELLATFRDVQLELARKTLADALEMSGCDFSSFGANESFEIETLADGTKVNSVLTINTVDWDSLIQVETYNYERPAIPRRKAPAVAVKICILNETLLAGAFGLRNSEEGYGVYYRELIELSRAPEDSAPLAELLAAVLDSSFRTFRKYEASLWEARSPDI